MALKKKAGTLPGNLTRERAPCSDVEPDSKAAEAAEKGAKEWSVQVFCPPPLPPFPMLASWYLLEPKGMRYQRKRAPSGIL
jgi:hypothetical protein